MKSIKWLSKRSYPPNIYLFRHLERGSIIYSQIPQPTLQDINNLFPRANQENKKPVYGQRRDLWKLMCFIKLGDYKLSNQLYRDLIHLRHLRDVKGINTGQRKLNEMGQIWYSGQYRPVYSQEAIADLRECLVKSGISESTIYWEDEWRKGDWDGVLPGVEHKMIPRVGNINREESEILKELSRVE